MAEIEITPDNFETETGKDTPIVVDFWASWCGPCKMMAPVFEELSNEYDEGTLRFGKCNVESYADLATQNNISGIPALVVYKNGKEIDRITGFAQKDGLKEQLDKIIS